MFPYPTGRTLPLQPAALAPALLLAPVLLLQAVDDPVALQAVEEGVARVPALGPLRAVRGDVGAVGRGGRGGVRRWGGGGGEEAHGRDIRGVGMG